MNQALIGAMTETGPAGGRETIEPRVILGILGGWIIVSVAGAALGFVFALVSRLF